MCDPIDERHKGVLSPEIWGDGDPEGVRQRAAEAMKDTARAAAQLGVDVVTGFTGSPTWHMVYSFPPNDFDEIERGYQEFAERWGPIIDVFESEGVRFALEVHPTEIAYDFVTTRKTLDAIGDRPGFGINFDPSHFEHQFLDSAAFITEFGPKIYHAHIKDSVKHLDGRSSILGGHLNFGEPGRGWDFVSPGHGDVDFESMIRALEPDRVQRSPVDRVGGFRDGPRLGGAGRPRLRAPRRTSPPPRSRSTQPSRRSPECPKSDSSRWARPPVRRRSSPSGSGMLGYAFMGKAHSNAYKTLAYMTWPPPLMPQLVAIAGPQRGGGRRRRRGATGSPST